MLGTSFQLVRVLWVTLDWRGKTDISRTKTSTKECKMGGVRYRAPYRKENHLTGGKGEGVELLVEVTLKYSLTLCQI